MGRHSVSPGIPLCVVVCIHSLLCIFTDRKDYIPHPLEKPHVHQGDPYVTPEGDIDLLTTNKRDYTREFTQWMSNIFYKIYFRKYESLHVVDVIS